MYTVASESELVDVGTAANKVTSFVIYDSNNKNVTKNFTNISYVNGTLEVTKANVTLTSGDGSKTYDGTALTNDEVTASGFVGNDGASYNVTGSQTLVGSSDNTFTYTLNDGVKAGNYDITVVYGTLTVTDGSETTPVNPDDAGSKTFEGEKYDVGDVITYTVTATNIYSETKTITITENLKGAEIAQSVFEDVPAGETVSTTVTYTVTEADVRNGSVNNSVTVSYSGEDTRLRFLLILRIRRILRL